MKSSADTAEVKRIQDHVVWFEPPDICVVRFGETLAYEDGLEVYEEEVRLGEEHGAIFVLADLTGVRSITAEARKIAAEIKMSPQILGVANFGVSFQIRVLAKLVITLRRLAGQQIEGVLYMGANEADARAWIAERRLERSRKGG